MESSTSDGSVRFGHVYDCLCEKMDIQTRTRRRICIVIVDQEAKLAALDIAQMPFARTSARTRGTRHQRAS